MWRCAVETTHRKKGGTETKVRGATSEKRKKHSRGPTLYSFSAGAATEPPRLHAPTRRPAHTMHARPTMRAHRARPRLPPHRRAPARALPPLTLPDPHAVLPPALADAAASFLTAVTGPHRDAAAAAVTAAGAYTLVKAAALVGSRGWADPVSFEERERRKRRGLVVGCSGAVGEKKKVMCLCFKPTPKKSNPCPQKLTRKVVHTLAGPGYTLCWPLFR